jgi:hypothetical protein
LYSNKVFVVAPNLYLAKTLEKTREWTTDKQTIWLLRDILVLWYSIGWAWALKCTEKGRKWVAYRWKVLACLMLSHSHKTAGLQDLSCAFVQYLK